jgi:hypothetical protein
MNKWIGAALLALTLCVTAGPANAGEQVGERRSVDARVVKVRLGGVIDLRLKQGPTPSLVVYGDKKHVARVSTSQDGDTLHIDTGNRKRSSSSDRKQLRAELTLPNLQEFVSHGGGSSDVNGFAGEEVTLSLDGAGTVTVTSDYRKIHARLGGVGSMTLNSGDSELVDLHLRGAGQIAVNGQSKLLRAKLGGVGSLDAQALRAEAVDLDMSGLGSATVFARTSVNLTLSGLGSVKVYGKPANRNSTARGLGSVSWE